MLNQIINREKLVVKATWKDVCRYERDDFTGSWIGRGMLHAIQTCGTLYCRYYMAPFVGRPTGWVEMWMQNSGIDLHTKTVVFHHLWFVLIRDAGRSQLHSNHQISRSETNVLPSIWIGWTCIGMRCRPRCCHDLRLARLIPRLC